MKKIWITALLMMVAMGTIASADPIYYYDGEGFIEPTQMSREQVSQYVLRTSRAAGDNVTISVDSAAFPEIVLTTTIVDQNGQPISGLTQDMLSVTEQSNREGTPTTQTMTCFEESAGTGESVTVALVFDLSGSMNHDGRLDAAKVAANHFFTNFSDSDRGALVTFSSGGSEKIVIPSGTINRLKDAIDALTAEGFTAIYDGTAKGIESIRNDPAPKAVVVFSDGQTNSDRSHTINSVIAEALEEGIAIYTIGLGIDLNNMRILAESTGGDYYFSPTPQDMSAIYDEIARSIKNQYRICYTSHNPTLDGTTRTVIVNYDGTQGTGYYTVPAELSADFSWQPQVPTPNADVVFTDKSVTHGQQISDYLWNFGALGTSSEASPTISFPNEGTYPVTLTITTDSGETASYTKNITVSLATVPPKAEFTWSPVMPLPQTNVEFTNTSTPADSIVNYYWDFGAAGTSNDRNPIISFPEQGVIPVTLTVTDRNGLTDTVTNNVTVSGIPRASFNWSPEIQGAGAPVSFTDTSTPGLNPITNWSWTFGNEGISSEPNPRFIFDRQGTYQVTLVVQDERGFTNSATRYVTIQGCAGDCEADGGCFIDSAYHSSRINMTLVWLAIVGCILLSLGLLLARRKKIRVWIIPCLTIFAVVGIIGMHNAQAGVTAGKFTLSPMIGMYVFDDDQNIDKGLLLGLGAGYNITDHIGAEIMLNFGKYTYHYMNPRTCRCAEDDLKGFFPHIDLLYHFRPAEKLVPYIGIGGGVSILDFDSFDKETSAAVNLGGGLKFFLTDNIALRADVRGIHVFDDSRNNLAATAGLLFQFPMGTPRTPRDVERPKPIAEPPQVTETAPRPTTVVTPPTTEEAPTRVVPPPDKVKEEPPPVVVVTPPPPKEEPVAPPVDTGVSIDLKILFDFDKSVIKPIYHNNIKYVADIMKKYPDIAIEIEGHTCSIGTEKYNLGLSRRRAESVKRYLNEKFGIDNHRMTTNAYGESRPAYDNRTKEGRKSNRRVIVIRIVR